MSSTNGLLLIIVGLIVLYIGVTDKYCCFAGAFKCIFGGGCTATGQQTAGAGSGGSNASLLPNFSFPSIGGNGIGSGGILQGGLPGILSGVG